MPTRTARAYLPAVKPTPPTATEPLWSELYVWKDGGATRALFEVVDAVPLEDGVACALQRPREKTDHTLPLGACRSRADVGRDHVVPIAPVR